MLDIVEHTYDKVYNADGTYWIRENRVEGISRQVDESQFEYSHWVAAGNQPTEVPYVPPSIESVKAAKNAEIAEARWKAEIAPFWYEAKSAYFDTSERSQIKYLKALENGTTTMWKTTTGTWVEMTVTDFSGLIYAYELYVAELFNKEQTKCLAIDNATTIEEIEIIQW